jgi:hypothetical protein
MYASILDPEDKTQELSDKLFRAWIRLLCAYTRGNGIFPPQKALARCLKVTEERLEEILASLEQVKLIDMVDGIMVPHNWDDRQFESDTSAERTKRWRDRHRDVSSDVHVTSHVTPSENREQRTENRSKEHTHKQRRSAPAETPEFVCFWEAYPRKKDKAAARKAFTRWATGPEMVTRIMDTLKAQSAELDLKLTSSADFRPYPASWLNSEPWNDAPTLFPANGHPKAPVHDPGYRLPPQPWKPNVPRPEGD